MKDLPSGCQSFMGEGEGGEGCCEPTTRFFVASKIGDVGAAVISVMVSP